MTTDRPDIVVEHVSGIYLFSGETAEGRQWLAGRREGAGYERVGNSIAVSAGGMARDLVAAAVADGLDVLE